MRGALRRAARNGLQVERCAARFVAPRGTGGGWSDARRASSRRAYKSAGAAAEILHFSENKRAKKARLCSTLSSCGLYCAARSFHAAAARASPSA